MEKSKKGGGAQPVSDETFEILQQKRCKPSKALDEVLLKKRPPRSTSCYQWQHELKNGKRRYKKDKTL